MSLYLDKTHQLLARVNRLYRFIELGSPREFIETEIGLIQNGIDEVRWPIDGEHASWISRRYVRKTWRARVLDSFTDRVLIAWGWVTGKKVDV